MLYLKPGYTLENVIYNHKLLYDNWTPAESDAKEAKEYYLGYQKELDRAKDILIAELNAYLRN